MNKSGDLAIWPSLLVFFGLLSAGAFAQEAKAGAAAGAPALPPSAASAPREFITRHKLVVAGETLSYTAVAGEIVVNGDDGTPEASLFCISYLKDGVARPEDRPLTFLFNGGPGSSSVWLHMGAFGPRRIVLPDEPVVPGAAPYRMTDNEDTLLRYSDLVFVDPVGTGYSRALGKKTDRDFWGVDQDGAVLARYIRAYLTANKRWNSPKYLAGESYGTLRAAVLVRDLELVPLDGLSLNGVVLMSVAIDPRTFMPGGPGNELPFVTDLPTYAATAAYHRALPQQPADLGAFLGQVEGFASSEYLTALFKGDGLAAAERESIVQTLHRYTGLSPDYIRQAHLRIEQNRFRKELLRGRGLVLGIYDTRYTGRDLDEAGETVALDPFMFGIAGPFVAAVNSYLENDLGVRMDRPYVVFALEAAQVWKRPAGFDYAFAGFIDAMPDLSRAAATNRDFRVFVACGLYDLATPYYGTRHIFDQSGIDKDRLTFKAYDSGHMIYLYPPAGKLLAADIGAFMNRK